MRVESISPDITDTYAKANSFWKALCFLQSNSGTVKFLKSKTFKSSLRSMILSKESSISSSEPFAKMVSIPSLTWSEKQRISFPAWNASHSSSPGFENNSATAFISFPPVKEGMAKWPTMIISTLLAIPYWKGTNSSFSNSSFVLEMIGRPRCESVLVSPCPGKCLRQPSIPPLSIPW